jgi:hypothetical protein
VDQKKIRAPYLVSRDRLKQQILMIGQGTLKPPVRV